MAPIRSLNVFLMLAVLFAVARATVAEAGTDTCAGSNATIGETCTPLLNSASGDHEDIAVGLDALIDNTTGSQNTAVGGSALLDNTTGSDNTATGVSALQNNSTGSNNTATGENALISYAGNNNIAIGFGAGDNLRSGDDNIYIGNEGSETQSDTIQIGTQGIQTVTIIAGIFGGARIKKGCDVVANNFGLLGCVTSSARYKRDIRDMGDASDRLMKLRPVIFQYKEDSEGIRQYGLIAEEVEKVYPELVVDGTDGRPETVEYQVLPAMLLNEVQKQSRQLARKDAQIAAIQRQLVALQKRNSEIDEVAVRLDALERQARAAIRPIRRIRLEAITRKCSKSRWEF